MSKVSKQTVKIMLVLELVALVAGMFFIKQPLYYALGIAAGTAVSAARFLLLERTLNKSVDMAPADAQNYVRLHYGLRMAAIVVIAVIAAKVKYIDLWGFVIGLLPVQPAVYIRGLLVRNADEGK
ncbi:MAG: ATP synthase subunit I [Firmicutes bacterium]|nr:ATP synthase subunit I [Bacillota bacterium]